MEITYALQMLVAFAPIWLGLIALVIGIQLTKLLIRWAIRAIVRAVIRPHRSRLADCWPHPTSLTWTGSAKPDFSADQAAQVSRRLQ